MSTGGSSDAVTASGYAGKLGTVLLAVCAVPGTELHRQLRREIASIGLCILREWKRLRSGAAHVVADTLAVSNAMRDSLL